MGTGSEFTFVSKDIVIVHPYSEHEVRAPKFGGARLIAEQIRYFEDQGFDVRVISLTSIGSLTSFLYRLQARLRMRSRETGSRHSSEEARWRINLIQVI